YCRRNVSLAVDRDFCGCSSPCSEEVYKVLLSHSQWPSDVAETSKYISDIGGMIGLWFGCSAFTLIEFLELFLTSVVVCSFRRY
ncbi:hypothetical protein LSH36_217g05007, partial [Paralvinella palmiformis]